MEDEKINIHINISFENINKIWSNCPINVATMGTNMWICFLHMGVKGKKKIYVRMKIRIASFFPYYHYYCSNVSLFFFVTLLHLSLEKTTNFWSHEKLLRDKEIKTNNNWELLTMLAFILNISPSVFPFCVCVCVFVSKLSHQFWTV